MMELLFWFFIDLCFFIVTKPIIYYMTSLPCHKILSSNFYHCWNKYITYLDLWNLFGLWSYLGWCKKRENEFFMISLVSTIVRFYELFNSLNPQYRIFDMWLNDNFYYKRSNTNNFSYSLVIICLFVFFSY